MLNRVDGPVTITAKAKDGAEVWIGRAALRRLGPRRIRGTAVRDRGLLGDWALRTSTAGQGTAPALGQADVWRQLSPARARRP